MEDGHVKKDDQEGADDTQDDADRQDSPDLLPDGLALEPRFEDGQTEADGIGEGEAGPDCEAEEAACEAICRVISSGRGMDVCAAALARASGPCSANEYGMMATKPNVAAANRMKKIFQLKVFVMSVSDDQRAEDQVPSATLPGALQRLALRLPDDSLPDGRRLPRRFAPRKDTGRWLLLAAPEHVRVYDDNEG